MNKEKLKIVHYVNQFFGQIGGEDKSEVGFSLEKKPVGPGIAVQNELGDTGEIVPLQQDDSPQGDQVILQFRFSSNRS